MPMRMTMDRRTICTLLPLATLVLSACSATGGAPPPQVGFTPATRPQTGVLVGMDARALQRQFGKPRLDIRDPTARKLQFANDRCILDAYLYAPAENREPVVTYFEARTPAGVAADGNACAKILKEGK